MRIAKIAATWILQILLGVLFVVLGAAKFGDSSWVRKFAEWGYPSGFYMVVGVLEIAGGLMVLVPRVASYGSLVIMTVMIGATVTHLTHGEMQRVNGPIMFLLLAAAVGWLRRNAALSPTRARGREQAVI
jgi:uncharacterized membrane protein YphA (DoxX/SURF4 family)